MPWGRQSDRVSRSRNWATFWAAAIFRPCFACVGCTRRHRHRSPLRVVAVFVLMKIACGTPNELEERLGASMSAVSVGDFAVNMKPSIGASGPSQRPTESHGSATGSVRDRRIRSPRGHGVSPTAWGWNSSRSFSEGPAATSALPAGRTFLVRAGASSRPEHLLDLGSVPGLPFIRSMWYWNPFSRRFMMSKWPWAGQPSCRRARSARGHPSSLRGEVLNSSGVVGTWYLSATLFGSRPSGVCIERDQVVLSICVGLRPPWRGEIVFDRLPDVVDRTGPGWRAIACDDRIGDHVVRRG
jgi:hypothetical protein